MKQGLQSHKWSLRDGSVGRQVTKSHQWFIRITFFFSFTHRVPGNPHRMWVLCPSNKFQSVKFWYTRKWGTTYVNKHYFVTKLTEWWPLLPETHQTEVHGEPSIGPQAYGQTLRVRQVETVGIRESLFVGETTLTKTNSWSLLDLRISIYVYFSRHGEVVVRSLDHRLSFLF